jgi:hypothetical protein
MLLFAEGQVAWAHSEIIVTVVVMTAIFELVLLLLYVGIA